MTIYNATTPHGKLLYVDTWIRLVDGSRVGQPITGLAFKSYKCCAHILDSREITLVVLMGLSALILLLVALILLLLHLPTRRYFKDCMTLPVYQESPFSDLQDALELGKASELDSLRLLDGDPAHSRRRYLPSEHLRL